MCIPNRQLDPKTRRRTVIANISLVIGLLLWIFVHPSGPLEKDWLDAVCGFLLGLSVTINLFGLWSAHRCGGTATGKL
ncbi:MAG: hypothetical protein ABSC76_20835 [Terracidiphilus sp.]|jgi:hypothetical protein